MLNLCQHVWFPHIHRSIVHMAQSCKHCTEQGKNLKPIIGKKSSFQMEPVVEPNEEVHLEFAGQLLDELNKDVNISCNNKRSKFPTAKVVTNSRADGAIKFMQRYISNNGVPGRLRCDQAQTKKFQVICNTNNMKLLFAPVDDNRAIMVVERMVQTIKRRLVVRRIDQCNTPYKKASDVGEVLKSLRITPQGITKISPFERHMSRKTKNALSNGARFSSPITLIGEMPNTHV